MTAVLAFPRRECGHSMLAHDLNAKRVRTACSVYDHKGQCRCRMFRARKESGGER